MYPDETTLMEVGRIAIGAGAAYMQDLEHFGGTLRPIRRASLTLGEPPRAG